MHYVHTSSVANKVQAETGFSMIAWKCGVTSTRPVRKVDQAYQPSCLRKILLVSLAVM